MDKDTRFFYLVPALTRSRFSYESRWAHLRRLMRGRRQVPSGGVKIIYQHCDMLNNNGWRAHPVHLGDFVIDWFPHASEALTKEQALAAIRPGDVVVCPEVIPWAAAEFPCRNKIVFIQAWSLVEIATGRSKRYEDFGFTGLVACSQYTQQYMATRSRLACALVRNGIDLAAFSPGPSARVPRSVLCFNRRNIQDGRAARRLLPPPVRGSAVFTELENRYAQAQVIDFYRASDIFMALGYPEGFALPPLEAMACGCAVIGFTGGGAGEFMIDGVTALVSPDGDARSLAGSLERVLADDALKERLRAAGMERARRYSLENMEQDLIGFAAGLSGEMARSA